MRAAFFPSIRGGPEGNRNGAAMRTSTTRGAIRTHLGRKRTGPRARALRDSTLRSIGEVTGAERHRQEKLFDPFHKSFQELLTQAGRNTLATRGKALEAPGNGLVG